MDNKTNLDELKALIQKFCEDREWDQFHSPKDLAIGIVTEAAELLEHFRFKSPEEIAVAMADKGKREQINDEIADILYFVLRFSQMYGVDLGSELKRKMDKNALKYPVEKARGSNKKYTEF